MDMHRGSFVSDDRELREDERLSGFTLEASAAFGYSAEVLATWEGREW